MASQFFHTFSTDVSGWQMMWMILCFGLIALAIMIERGLFVYVKSNINANLFMAEIRKLVSAGDFKKAIALCKAAGEKALPKVVLAALAEADRREFIDYRAIQNAVDEATLELIPKLSKRTGYLAVLGNVATLTGLLGTIYGLILSFQAAGAAGGGAEALAQGIAIAMFTTMWGLVVAIPAIIAYTLINTKTNDIIDDIDEHSVKLIHLLTGGK
ncbi:MAG: MotA/TolQ/ExbB proton channel family protein [Calditrichaeota bacterium]|nr:MotA/TolQ/ExbB proton channel family protein [Calditrichota bacterium]